ncbi:MAG: OmpA family protein [Flavobacteriales bacterium]|nr:OmpA family protein [Flavobacteriales bacterium]
MNAGKIILPFITLLILISSGFAQQSSKKASKFFNKGAFDKALVEYAKLDTSLIKDNDNFKIGACYFLAIHNQTDGISYLEKYITQADSVIAVAHFYLGSLYHKNYDFDKAIETLELFSEKLEMEYASKNINTEIYEQFRKETETIIANCNYAKIMVKSPRKVLTENLGDSINTKYQEYAPAISIDEKKIVFTSRRPETTGNKISDDGDYYEDIYMAELKKGSLFDRQFYDSLSNTGFFNLVTQFEYSYPTHLPEIINSKTHDASIQLSNDGNKLYFYRNSDVWTSTKNDTSWSDPIQLLDINTASFEPSVFITLDEQTMFITSEKEGGFGKMDIYISEKDSTGNWSEMKNLGPKINTATDEDISYVSPKKDIIYFSSKGHSSMGGYDIFKSIKKGGKWSAPINMGSPVNTPYNDAFFVMTPKYNRGYYASERPEGKGGMDLYRLTFADERNSLAELAGLVLQGDSLVPAYSKITIAEIGSTISTVQTSKKLTGEYLILLEHGKKYEMLVETKGFTPYKKTFVIPDQVEYYQLYQEIHHIYIKDSEGNIIGQKIITYNAFYDIENATRNDTVNHLYDKSKYSDHVRDSANRSIEKFIDVKFYMTEDSLMRLLENDKSLKFIFSDIAEISFLYKNDKDFRLALNAYVEGKIINREYLARNSFLVNEIKNTQELTDKINDSDNQKIIVLFDYENSNLDQVAKRELDILLNYMKQNIEVKFLIKGHTDSKGSNDYNQKLALKRVEKVEVYLISNGISKQRLKYKSYGETLPIAPNVNIDGSDNPEGRVLNRRVEFDLIK